MLPIALFSLLVIENGN